MYLKRKIWDLECEAQINKIEINKNAAVATKAQKELDVAKFEARKLSGVVSKVQKRLDTFEDLMSNRSDRLPALDSGSDNSWGPGPGPGIPYCVSEALRSDHVPSTCSSAPLSDSMPQKRIGDEETDKWLSADYRRRRDSLRTLVQPKRPRHAPERCTERCGMRSWRRTWSGTSSVPITPPWRICQSEPRATRGTRVHGRRVLSSPWRRERGGGAAQPLGHQGGDERGSRGNPRVTLVGTFVNFMAGGHGLEGRGCRHDIRPHMYDGDPLNLGRLLERLDDWGMTVTEDMDPAAVEKYVFKRFGWQQPELLQEPYFVAAKEGNIPTLEEARRWLKEQERVYALQVAAKRWKAIKLQHDGREIRLRVWRDF